MKNRRYFHEKEIVLAKKKTRKIKRKIFTALGLVTLLVGLAIFLFSGDNFIILQKLFRDDLTQEQIRELLGSLGYKGYLTMGTLSFLQVVLTFIPAEPVQVMAGISFGVWYGGLICLAGVFVGNTVIYILYKIYGEKLERYFKKNAEFDFDEARKSPKIALVIFILYFLPAIPYGLICFFTASLNKKYYQYILLTTLGSIPSILIGVALGHLAMAASWILSICVFIVLLTLLIIVFKNKAAIFAKVNEFMKKQANYSSKTTVGKTHSIILRIASFISTLILRPKMKYTLKNNVGKLDKPCIVLCTHGSFLDFVYSGKLLVKEKPHYVAARMYFYKRNLAWLLRKAGAFPKSMFTSDVENAKNCVRVISSGGTLVMMPEARLSTAGKFEGIQDSTYRFIQKMNVAVYTISLNGSYLAKPKWGDKTRKGALVEARLDPLFKAGETKELPFEEVQKRVNDALYYDDFAWLETKPNVQYKSKTLAKGLENILTLCPSCGAHYTMQTDKLKIFCSECGFERTLNSRYGFTVPSPHKNLAEWYEYQKSEMEKAILESPDFRLESEVTLMHHSFDGKKILREAGKGVCVLDRKGLLYRGTRDGEEVEKLFPLSDIYRILFGAGEDFEIYEGEQLYYFVPTEKRSCVDWYTASELLKKVG